MIDGKRYNMAGLKTIFASMKKDDISGRKRRCSFGYWYVDNNTPMILMLNLWAVWYFCIIIVGWWGIGWHNFISDKKYCINIIQTYIKYIPNCTSTLSANISQKICNVYILMFHTFSIHFRPFCFFTSKNRKKCAGRLVLVWHRIY